MPYPHSGGPFLHKGRVARAGVFGIPGLGQTVAAEGSSPGHSPKQDGQLGHPPGRG